MDRTKAAHKRIMPGELFLHALLLVALLAVLFPSVFTQGHILLPGGILFEYPPWKAYTPDDFEPVKNTPTLESLCEFHMYYSRCDQAFNEGNWPLWNPTEYTGVPLLASYQPAIFYPPRLLHRFMDLYRATTLYILLKLWLCGAMAYLCARGFGLGRPASSFLSVGWMLCSYHTVWCYWPLPDVGAWLPLLILGAEWIVQQRYRRGFCVLAMGATLILLAGHPETAFTMGLSTGLYFLIRLLFERPKTRDLWRPFAAALGAWLAALLIAAAQLLPFLEYMVNSYHFLVSHGESGEHAVPLAGWVLGWVPRFYGTTTDQNFWYNHINSNFMTIVFPGIAAWFGLGLLKDFRTWDRLGRARMFGLLACVLVAFLCATNQAFLGPLLNLPLLSSTWRTWFLGGGIFALQFIGAYGVERWFSRPRRLRETLWFLLPVGLPLAGAVALYKFHARVLAMQGLDAYVRHHLLVAIVIAILCFGCFAAYCLWRRPRVLAALLILVFAGDLIHAVRGTHPTCPRSWLFFDTELTDYLDTQEEPYRLSILTSGIPTGFMPIYGFEQWFGYGGILPLRFSRFFREMGEDTWRSMMPALGIRFFLHDAEQNPYFLEYAPERFKLATTLNGVEVYEDTGVFDRAFLVETVRVVPSIDDMLDVMRDADFDPLREALIEAPLPATPQGGHDGSLGTARVVARTTTSVTVEADAEHDCILVLADAYYPGWDVAIDGAPAEVFPVYSVFRGVVLPKGQHTVSYSYFPWSLRIGLLVSTAALLASVLASICLLRRKGPIAEGRTSRNE